MANSDSSMSEYMKIRKYIFNLILKTNGEAIRLPSILELSEKFKVSRPTVSKALKALSDEGYIKGKRGIGSFANPDKIFASALNKGFPTVGILMGDGMTIHYERFLTNILAHLMLKIVNIPSIIHFINLSSVDTDKCVAEILDEQVDILVWNGVCSRSEVLPKLRAAGLKVVTSDSLINNIDSVCFDYFKLGYECGKLLIKEGRKIPVFLMASLPYSLPLDGLKKAYEEAGITLNEHLFLEDGNTCLDELKKIIQLGIPVDAVFNPVFVRGEVEDLLRECNIDRSSQCRLIQGSISSYGQKNANDIIFHFPFERYAENVANLVKEVLESDGPIYPETILTEIEISTGS